MLVIYGTNSVKLHPPPPPPKKIIKKYKLKCTPWQGTLQIYPYYLQRDKGHTTSYSDYFFQSRNSRCEILQSLRVWEVSINRNNCKIKTDHWSKIRPTFLNWVQCHQKFKNTQDTNVYFCHLGMHRDWNQVQKMCSQPVLQISVLQKQDQTLVPLQNLKVKRSTWEYSVKDMYHIWHHRGCIHIKKKHHFFLYYVQPAGAYDICDNEYVLTTKIFLLKNKFLLKLL